MHTTPARIANPIPALTLAATLALTASSARAQWTVTNLHPAGATFSWALGASGTQQVGRIDATTSHASLWSGTAASWVDLHPAGATRSQAWSTTGTHQVGYAEVGGVQRASLCRGSTASWVDLTPVSALASQAFAAYDVQQVGWAYVGGLRCASLWNGTAESWEDLSAVLPGSWGTTEAWSISSDGLNTYIAGFGYNNATQRNEALLWSRPLNTCYADCDNTTGNGVLDLFDFLCFQNSFVNGETYACDCDTSTGAGVCDVFDFLCFQDALVGGCP